MISETIFATPTQQPSIHCAEVRVVLIDDQIIVAEALRRMLADRQEIKFHAVLDPRIALQQVLRIKPTVILLDLVMPSIDGFELLRQFRSDANTRDIPIIVLSTTGDVQTKVRCFAAGANDYLIKLPDPLELLARLTYHSAAYVSRQERDSAFRALHASQQQLAEANIKLQQLAEIDGLTGIANRRRFDDVLHAEWQRAMRNQCPVSLILCDIDFFKLYNDTHGHLAGDACLREVASVLQRNLRRPADLAARYGGEEFALILPETDYQGAYIVAEQCRLQIAALAIAHRPPVTAEVMTMSAGIAALVPSKDSSPLELIALADRALYNAKNGGRNRVFPSS